MLFITKMTFSSESYKNLQTPKWSLCHSFHYPHLSWAWRQMRGRSFITGSRRASECCCVIVFEAGWAVENTGGFMDFFPVFNLTTDAITIALMSLTSHDVQNRKIFKWSNEEDIKGKNLAFLYSTVFKIELTFAWWLACLFPNLFCDRV